MVRANKSIRVAAMLISSLAIVGVPNEQADAQTPGPTGQKALQQMVEYLARDGGRWRAANPQHQASNPRSPDAYGLWFESTSQGHLLELSIVLHFGDQVRPSMKSYWFWHPGRQEIIYQEVSSSGGFREGTCHFEGEKTFVTLTKAFSQNGAVNENRGVNILSEDDLHVTTAYSKGADGQWVEQASLTWTRTPVEKNEQSQIDPPGDGSIDLLDYVGYYMLGEHHPVVVSYRTMGGGERKLLVLTDLKTDAVRAMFPIGAGSFIIGHELTQQEPAAAELHFKRLASGSGMHLEFAPSDAEPEVGFRVAIQTEDILFTHDGVSFGATLYTPPGDGPAPGALLEAGSSNQDANRFSLDAMAWVLASRGFVVLAYDKRGVGTTGGNLVDSLDMRAEDGAAALNELRRHVRVDPDRVGVIGYSQGAWVAPMIADIDGNVAFLIPISGGGLTLADAFLHKYKHRYYESGKTGEDLENAMTHPRGVIKQSKLRVEAGQGTEFDVILLYDPKDIWQDYEGAVLCLLGEMDVLQDSTASADWLRVALVESKCVDWQIKVFPKAHHPMYRGTTGLASEFAQMNGVSHFVPGYWSTLIYWLDQRYGGQTH